jgi:hypothetical protein
MGTLWLNPDEYRHGAMKRRHPAVTTAWPSALDSGRPTGSGAIRAGRPAMGVGRAAPEIERAVPAPGSAWRGCDAVSAERCR